MFLLVNNFPDHGTRACIRARFRCMIALVSTTQGKRADMHEDEFLALTPFDWEQDEACQDYPSIVLANLGYRYEAYGTQIRGGFAWYELMEWISPKDTTWNEFMNEYIRPEHAQDYLSVEQFNEYAHSGLAFA